MQIPANRECNTECITEWLNYPLFCKDSLLVKFTRFCQCHSFIKSTLLSSLVKSLSVILSHTHTSAIRNHSLLASWLAPLHIYACVERRLVVCRPIMLWHWLFILVIRHHSRKWVSSGVIALIVCTACAQWHLFIVFVVHLQSVPLGTRARNCSNLQPETLNYNNLQSETAAIYGQKLARNWSKRITRNCNNLQPETATIYSQNLQQITARNCNNLQPKSAAIYSVDYAVNALSVDETPATRSSSATNCGSSPTSVWTADHNHGGTALYMCSPGRQQWGWWPPHPTSQQPPDILRVLWSNIKTMRLRALHSLTTNSRNWLGRTEGHPV